MFSPTYNFETIVISRTTTDSMGNPQSINESRISPHILNVFACMPLIGTPFGAYRSIVGSIDTVIGVALLIFGSFSKGQSVFWTGCSNTIQGAIEIIPGVGTIPFLFNLTLQVFRSEKLDNSDVGCNAVIYQDGVPYYGLNTKVQPYFKSERNDYDNVPCNCLHAKSSFWGGYGEWYKEIIKYGKPLRS